MFKEVVQLLSHFPTLGRKLDNREERYFIKDHYQIFYVEDEETIQILHIYDSRRNVDELISKD